MKLRDVIKRVVRAVEHGDPLWSALNMFCPRDTSTKARARIERAVIKRLARRKKHD